MILPLILYLVLFFNFLWLQQTKCDSETDGTLYILGFTFKIGHPHLPQYMRSCYKHC